MSAATPPPTSTGPTEPPHGRPPAAAEASPERDASPWLALLLVVLAPTLLLGGPILAKERFLPHLPVALEPLAAEHPEAAARARERIAYGPADRIFPTLSDQLAMRAELANLDLPTWEPHLGLGAPLFANSIAGPCYPPNWLGLALPPDLAAGPLAWLTLVLAGLGMGLFLRRIGLGVGACAVGVIGVQLGGWGIANLFYFMKVDAALWLPLSLWAVEGMARGIRRSGLWLFLATALSLLAGFPPIALFSIATTLAYALVRFTAPGARLLGAPAETLDPGSLRGPKLVLRLGLLLALGMAAASWQLLPTVEASRESLRQGNTVADLERQSLPLATLAGVVVPDLVGAPTEPPAELGPPVAWWLTPAADWSKAMNANALEWNTFAGIGLVLLGAAALCAWPRRAGLPAAALVLCYGFAQGWPGARSLYHLPGLGAGAPNRMLAVAWVLWPWLAALGAEALFTGRARARAGLFGAALLLALGAGAFAAQLAPDEFGSELQATLFERYAGREDAPTRDEVAGVVPLDAAVLAGERLRSAAWLVAALAAAYAGAASLSGRLGARGATALVAALVLCEGTLTSRGHLLSHPTGALEVFPASEALDAVREAAGTGRVVRLDRSGSGVGEVHDLGRPNLLQVYGISDLTPWTVFTPRGLVELVEDLDPGARFRSGIARVSSPELLGAPLLDLLRVSCVLARDPVEHPALSAVLARPGFHVYRRAGALAPARIVATGVATPSDEVARGLLVGGGVDLSHQALLAPGVEPRPAVPDAGQAEIVAVRRPAKNRLDVEVRGSRGGLLVLHEQFFPGWKATVNGADAELLRVDHVYRGLWLPEGDVVVRTWYEPWSLRVGFGLTLLALFAAGFLTLRRGW
ncbi:MAG: hypothetical protein AAF682_18090 [Planctomycetota bacterium]